MKMCLQLAYQSNMAWSKVMNHGQGDVLAAYQVRLFSRTRNPVTQKFHSHGNFFPLRTTCLSSENHPILLLQQNRTKVEMHAIPCWRGLAVRQNLVEIRVIHPFVRRQISASRRLKARGHCRIARKENHALDVEDNGCLAGLQQEAMQISTCCQGGPNARFWTLKKGYPSYLYI
jgi:hypothetical protein